MGMQQMEWHDYQDVHSLLPFKDVYLIDFAQLP